MRLLQQPLVRPVWVEVTGSFIGCRSVLTFALMLLEDGLVGPLWQSTSGSESGVFGRCGGAEGCPSWLRC